jgi:hypothetical protein
MKIMTIALLLKHEEIKFNFFYVNERETRDISLLFFLEYMVLSNVPLVNTSSIAWLISRFKE